MGERGVSEIFLFEPQAKSSYELEVDNWTFLPQKLIFMH